MSIELFPHIVLDVATDKTFRQSRLPAELGKRRYKRARRIVPFIWYTYGNEFLNYPSAYQNWPTETNT
ncbi:hypothetical protein [Kordiimonas aquimaris]|uniref:hypothetical protein n=1 Tax=Kordiimonas aquimaris TaxID=707591 RepID=UPI0021D39248|nr:hypothetical protein [Kordiimonas aquimaris]